MKLWTVVAAAMLGIGLVGCGGTTEQSSGGASSKGAEPAVTAPQTETPAASMDDMSNRLRTVTREMSSMVAEVPGGYAMARGQGKVELQARLAGMTESMNDLANSMNEVVGEMETVLADQQLMERPGMTRTMARMQLSLSAMLDSFSNMVDTLQELQAQPPQTH